MPRRSRLLPYYCLEFCKASCLRPSRPSCCCWPARRARISRFSDGFLEPGAIRIVPGTVASSRWSALSRSAPRASLLYINAEIILDTVLNDFANHPISSRWPAIFRRRPTLIWRDRECCTIFMMNWRLVMWCSASSVPMANCAICYRLTAWRRRPTVATGSGRSIVCLATRRPRRTVIKRTKRSRRKKP